MKVRAIKEYNDRRLNRIVRAGEEVTVSSERAEILVNAQVAGWIDEQEQEQEQENMDVPTKRAYTRKTEQSNS